MKKLNKPLQIIITLLFFITMPFLHAANEDFGAWIVTAEGHSGMNAGKMDFQEKELTVELWLNIDENEEKNTNETSILSNRHNGQNGFTISLNNNAASGNTDIRFFFRTADVIYTMHLPREEFSGKWGHMAFVVSSAERKAYSYLNGVLYDIVEDIDADWIGNRANDDFHIAYWYESPKFYGKIADIRVWNTARTGEQIRENNNTILNGHENGLYLYYKFGSLNQTILNAGSRGGEGYLLPGSTWSEVHDYEILSQKPSRLTITDELLTWEGQGDSWDVEVRSKTDDSVLKSETVTEKSFSLEGITDPYVIYVRTLNNGFYSGWTTHLIKIGCVGDSNTYGAEASNRSLYAWPVQIRSMLGDEYETQNFGVNGALMMDHLDDAWKNKTAYSQNKAYDPDIIIIALGTNDSKDNYWNAIRFKESYINLINEFKSYPADPEIYMAIPIKAYSNSWQINDATIRQSVIPVMKEISKEMGLPLIDLYAATNDIAGLMASDGIHPKDEGLKIMARKIADIMQTEKPRIIVGEDKSEGRYAEYRWYKDNILIENADQVTYTATEAGTYKAAVKLTADEEDIILSEPVEVTTPNTLLTVTGGSIPSTVKDTETDQPGITQYLNYIHVKNGEGAVFSIYSVSGQLSKKVTISSHSQMVDITGLKEGIYLCQLNKNGVKVTTKFIK